VGHGLNGLLLTFGGTTTTRTGGTGLKYWIWRHISAFHSWTAAV